MDSQAQKKALFRSKLREAAQKHDKRITSPLVRYNEYDQPVCRVCDVILKSEALWPAHQASRKHREAISNLKAAASGLSSADSKSNIAENTIKDKPRSVSTLPADFFDKQDLKKPKVANEDKSIAAVTRLGDLPSRCQPSEVTDGTIKEPCDIVKSGEVNEQLPFGQQNEKPRRDGPQGTQMAGSLPEGFFDNKDADLRARGIQPVKVDIKDEYKEFEKAIEDDLKEVDERLGEDEVDAAEMIEEAEIVEQKAYRERVELLKKKQMELKMAKISGEKKPPKFRGEESSDESSSSDEGSSIMDWRAQHL